MKLMKGHKVYIRSKKLLPKGASGYGTITGIGLARVEVLLNEGALVIVDRNKIKVMS